MEKNQFFITYSGVVEFVGDVQEKTSKAGKEYKLRDFAVKLNDTNPEYPVTLVFNLMGDKKVPLVNGMSKGEDVVIKFTINSKSYVNDKGETKYFLSLNLIEAVKGGMNQDNSHLNLDSDDGTDPLPF